MVGVLVQANYGRRPRLRVNGAPVGRLIPPSEVPLPGVADNGSGSIIVVVATNAPLIPTQCTRLAQRAALGIGRTGGLGEDSSGDLILAFTTDNPLRLADTNPEDGTVALHMLPNERINPLFEAVVDATEEAILNALLAAETMTGKGGATAHALPADRLVEILRTWNAPDGRQ